MRFKSVSKPWSCLICSQYFINLFHKASSKPSSRVYMWLGLDNKNILLSSSYSHDSDNGTTMSSFVIDQDLTIPAMQGYSVSQVFRGLMCFVNGSSAQIYNTTTRQLVVLPTIEESKIILEDHKKKNVKYLIGHDSAHDQYKVVCTVSRPSHDKGGPSATYMSEHWVLLLGGHELSRWRKISSPCPPHCPIKQGLTINGYMYYLAFVGLPYYALVRFDMSSEEISILQKPEDAWHHCCTDIIEYGGRVALLQRIHFYDDGEMDLWVMEDVEENRWSSMKTVVLHSSQMNMVNMHLVNEDMNLRVKGTTRNGEVILVPQNIISAQTGELIVQPQCTTLFYVFLYNLQENRLRKVEIKDPSDRYLTKIWDVIGFDDVENLMYL
ncbi:unnamed protein product [Arabis nemorensis]|uniref:F-box associated beta-propeller type 3 domain-containing protein n=1 Tax=Arabis nemorensis TaxID=586526 RepID=A0A565CFB5_9BRAS|nr:unnamed protein product [Arabis nemorensis]